MENHVQSTEGARQNATGAPSGEATGAQGPEQEPGKKKGLSLVGQMVVAVIAGFVIGFALLLFKMSIGEDSGLWQTINQLLFVDINSAEGVNGLGLVYDIQTLFLAALQLGIVPLVLTSLTLAILNVSSTAKLGRIAGRSIGWFIAFYVILAAIAGVIGLFVSSTGVYDVTLPTEGMGEVAAVEAFNPLAIIIDIVPNNLMACFSSNDGVLSVIFIAVVMGVFMRKMPEQTRPIRDLFQAIEDLVERYLTFVINRCAPISICCMIVRAFAIYGTDYLLPAAAYLVIGTLVGLVLTVTVMPLAILIKTHHSPIPFMKKTLRMLLITAATTSSSAGYPANVEAAENMGASHEVSSFVLPTGMVIHMPGTVVMQIMAVTFIATSAGFDITPVQMIVCAAVAVLIAIATPTIPMAGTVLIYVVMAGAGFTTDACMLAYALVVAINYPVGMACIMMNTLGDAATNVIVSSDEGEMDWDTYNA